MEAQQKQTSEHRLDVDEWRFWDFDSSFWRLVPQKMLYFSLSLPKCFLEKNKSFGRQHGEYIISEYAAMWPLSTGEQTAQPVWRMKCPIISE